MRCVWVDFGLSVGCPLVVLGSPMGCGWVSPGCSWASMRCLWGVHGAPIFAHGLPMECPWFVRGVSMGRPWVTHGSPMGCSWVNQDIPIKRAKTHPYKIHRMSIVSDIHRLCFHLISMGIPCDTMLMDVPRPTHGRPTDTPRATN